MAKQLYKIAGTKGTTEIEATPVDIFPWIKTIIHRGGINNSIWIVTEATTGYSLHNGSRTRKESIERAREILADVGEQKALTVIASKPCLNPLSTLK